MKKIQIKDFGTTRNGRKCHLYIMENDHGDRVGLTEFGAALVFWQVKDGDEIRDIVLGYDELSSYEKNDGNLGAVCGPYANRIRYGEFRLNDQFYRIPKDSEHVCHSGDGGFQNRVWSCDESRDGRVSFSYRAADKECGFPGNRKVKVSYSLTEERELMLSYEGETDQDTIFNLTNHSYFNLSGEGKIYNQYAEVNAPFITPVDLSLIPTGEILSVEGTGFDLREARKLEEVVKSDEKGIAAVGGLDHNFVLAAEERGELRYAARLMNPDSGMQLVCYTTEPGVQVYTANMLDAYKGSGGRTFGKHAGICFETQNFPAAPNICHFPDPTVRAGQKYTSQTIYSYVKITT